MSPATAAEWTTAVVWFRRDLRLADHPALAEAVTHALRVVPLFILDDRLLGGAAPSRSWFLRRSLTVLDAELRARGSALLVRHGRPEDLVPQVAAEVGAQVVLASRDVTPLSHRRDAAVASALERDGRRLGLRPGLLLTDPETMLTAAGSPYSVFTPFWRALQAAPRRGLLAAPDRVPKPLDFVGDRSLIDKMADVAPPFSDLPDPGERAAHARLSAWVGGGLADYGAGRDVLSGEGASRLSADLHFGTLSPLQVESAALDAGVDATPFVRQLVWREFYHHRLFHRRTGDGSPDGSLLSAFRSEDADPRAVEAWREGRTGIPVVDAGMRQLAATGWLSNRARLVVASFLTRHLLMDYRIGEQHFMRHLIDGDVANNRGGWQWTAGVGADPQPWFRIFNPVRQGLRFDPDGAWVRRWVPELIGIADRHVHAPWEAPVAPDGYPWPVVELAAARERALAAFRSASGRS